jgi:hypothetical protein
LLSRIVLLEDEDEDEDDEDGEEVEEFASTVEGG